MRNNEKSVSIACFCLSFLLVFVYLLDLESVEICDGLIPETTIAEHKFSLMKTIWLNTVHSI